MITAQRPAIFTTWSALRAQLAADARAFWDTRRIRRVLLAFAAILLLEVIITTAIYVGASGQLGRAPMWMHVLASWLGLKADWIQALVAPPPLMDLHGMEPSRSAIGIVRLFLWDVAGIAWGILMPVIAAVSFLPGSDAVRTRLSAGPMRRLLLRAAATVGPLAILTLTAQLLALLLNALENALVYAHPDLYPSEWMRQGPWLWAIGTFLSFTVAALVRAALLTSVAAAIREPAATVPACLGITFLVIPITVRLLFQHVIPEEVVLRLPSTLHVDLLLEVALLALALPFAIRSLRHDQPPLAVPA